AREANRGKEEMDEKAKERQFQMERDRADREAKAEFARIEGANAAEKMRYEAEQKAEMARHEASEKEKDRQLEENKIRLERDKLDAGTTRSSDETERRNGARGPKIAVWNDKEDMDGYLKSLRI